MSLPPTYNLLAKYPNRVYVETGIWRSDSIQLAIEARFEKIIGIDADIQCIAFADSRFYGHSKRKNLTFIHGDSSKILWDVIKGINEPITFFLDSHSQLLEGEVLYGKPFPLLDELKQIQAHPIKNHTLILDDILHLSHPDVTGWTKHQIEEAVRNINPDYKIEYVANPVKNNLAVCTI
ncbi:MAG: hypothetical protein ACTHMM_10000 [Agriterribacter sp.]